MNPNPAEQKHPLISVITVSLNAAEFIEQTIESVVSQTYPHIEYIIIDGGSTDGTVDIIRKYESRLSYWHSKPDRGLAHAFNLGFKQSHGDWILYLNADDFFLDTVAIEKMFPYLCEYSKADLVFGATIYMTNQLDPRPAPMKTIYGGSWVWPNFRFKDTIPHPSTFTARRYFDHVGEFDEHFRSAMDYEFFLRKRKFLNAQYVPILLTGMREGGISNKYTLLSYRECRIAQLKNNILPLWIAWLNFFWGIGRYYFGRVAHKILDSMAYKVTVYNRNTKYIYERYL